MTVVLTAENLKYKINENDHNPPHVHVEGPGASVRINLFTLTAMDEQTEFSTATLRKILAFVKENRIFLLDEWEARHG